MGAAGGTTTSAVTRALLSPRHVRRPRLTDVLDQATGPAIVIDAPAGYGKTMLAAEWLEDKPHAWYRAAPASADLAAFAVEVAEALTAFVPHAGERLRQRVRVGDAPEDAARPLAELLTEHLAAWPIDAWLVIDDYHLVANSKAIDEFVDWLLTLSPVQLLVTTRRRPRWATARRILYGEVTEIARDQLAMTDEEARVVLADHSPESIRFLIEQAQGWPAVIGLAGLSDSFAMPESRVAETLYRYFAEEVFRNEPPQVQQFMLAAAVPPVVDAQVARDVLELERPEATIERLEAEGLLQEAGGSGLRFHPLLRDFLLRQLTAEDAARAAELYERAVADARAGGRLEEAFELAAESENREGAADVLEDAATRLLELGRIETVERWLAVCGDSAGRRPALLLVKAEVLMRRGRLFEALALAHDLARRLPAESPHASPAWHVAGRAFHLLSQDERALDCHLRAVETARDPHDRVNGLWGAAVVEAQLESDVLDRLVTEMETVAAELPEARLQLLSGQVYLGSRKGSLAGIWANAEPLLHVAESAPDPIARSVFFIAGAYLNISRGRYRAARELIAKSLALLGEYRLGPVKRAFSLCQLVAAEVGLRKFADAEQALRDLAGLGLDHTGVLVAEQRNLRVKLLLARSGAAEVLERFDPADEGIGSYASRGEYVGLMAVATAAAGDFDRAHATAARAQELTRSIEARYYARLATLVATIVQTGETEANLRLAADVVADADRAEILDTVVTAYRAYPPLLQLVRGDAHARAVVEELVRQANDHSLAKKMGLIVDGEEVAAHGLTLLTPRENEVLQLMAEGLGNADIARRLFISEKTTKVHVYHIFEKLGVTTRVQAVLAARNLRAA